MPGTFHPQIYIITLTITAANSSEMLVYSHQIIWSYASTAAKRLNLTRIFKVKKWTEIRQSEKLSGALGRLCSVEFGRQPISE